MAASVNICVFGRQGRSQQGYLYPSVPEYPPSTFAFEQAGGDQIQVDRGSLIRLVSPVAFYVSLRMDDSTNDPTTYVPANTVEWMVVPYDGTGGWILTIHDTLPA